MLKITYVACAFFIVFAFINKMVGIVANSGRALIFNPDAVI